MIRLTHTQIVTTAFSTLGLALTLLLASTATNAQTIQIPVGQQAQDKQSIARPRAGMKQDQVRNTFGNPVEWTNPVGEPPISKWIYQDFIVVFEYDQVLHSLLVHTPQPGTEVASGEVMSDGVSDTESSNSLDVLSRTTD